MWGNRTFRCNWISQSKLCCTLVNKLLWGPLFSCALQNWTFPSLGSTCRCKTISCIRVFFCFIVCIIESVRMEYQVAEENVVWCASVPRRKLELWFLHRGTCNIKRMIVNSIRRRTLRFSTQQMFERQIFLRNGFLSRNKWWIFFKLTIEYKMSNPFDLQQSFRVSSVQFLVEQGDTNDWENLRSIDHNSWRKPRKVRPASIWTKSCYLLP